MSNNNNEFALQQKKKRKRHKSPAGALICCCRFVRPREKVPSPVYTARELSVASLAYQYQPTVLGQSQQRPLASNKKPSNSNGLLALANGGAFADDTPSNRGDYLDCGVQANMDEEEEEEEMADDDQTYEDFDDDDHRMMQTARTSRLEDIEEYPSMEALVSRMLGSSDSGEERSAAAESIISEAEQSRRQQQPNGRAEQQSWQKASSRDGIRLATIQSQHQQQRNRFPDLASVTVSSPASLCPSAGCLDPESQQQPWMALQVRHHQPAHSALRVAVSALPQHVSGLLWLAYAWMASSLAFLLEWIF